MEASCSPGGEEAPAAYRDIGEVLEDEADLVTSILRLTPIAVLKG